MSKIGVFDSGLGGLSVVNALRSTFNQDEVIFINDVDHLPYGTKTEAELERLARPHIEYLVDQGCDVIVIACNTLSTTVIPDIKDDFAVPIVALVPMVKPACLSTKNKTVAVLATPVTLKSRRYTELKAEFGQGIEFIEPDCSTWATMIESDKVDRTEVSTTIRDICDQGADVIVLGCTHYHWIEDIIRQETAGRAQVIQPEQAIVDRVRTLLSSSTG